MLHVSIHAGDLAGASRFNRLAWLDIGYQGLAPVADYKVVLFQAGLGAMPSVTLANYPRWSASLWDLVARSIALSLSPDPLAPAETVPAVSSLRKRSAFASQMCALIEHLPPGAVKHRRTLATASIFQDGQRRGQYAAHFVEHTMKPCSTAPFSFAPDVLRPAELLMHACLMRLTGTQEMPARPSLCVPGAVLHDGLRYVPLHRLVEPARTGFKHWLEVTSEPPLEYAGAPLGIAPEPMYAKFLREAV